jgi:3-carboxy-cis,cis-muconate cycloisomerase
VAALVTALGKRAGPDAARYVHWGATTQDILDTALALQLREALRLVEADLARLSRALAWQANLHRAAVMPGRTYMQHALPVTFGYKCAIWLDPLIRHFARLQELKPRVLRLQFGGAVGTLASLKGKGRAVVEALAEELDLAAPDAPWHVSRDGLAEAACVLGLLCGSVAKFATDLMLLMQTDVGEAFEPSSGERGGSSTLPQKRNPVGCAYIIAASRGAQTLVPLMLQAMAQDHERATGPWQSEFLALPQIFVLTSGVLRHAAELAEGMKIDAVRMRENLDITHGLVMSEAVMMELADKIGRARAHHIMQLASNRAIAEERALADVLAADQDVARHLDSMSIERLTDPKLYLGEAEAVIDRVTKQAEATFTR